MTLPGARTPGRFRLVVEQFEELPVSPKIKLSLVTPVARRLVFSDIVPL